MGIWLADANGRVVKAIISGNFAEFVSRIGFLMVFAVPSSMVNAGLDYFKNLLACAFR